MARRARIMKVFRISNLLSFALATTMGVLLFWTSQAVHHKEDALKNIQKKLEHEKEANRVLGVEWDYLNRPQRLEKLASEQLGMALPAMGGVVKSIDDIEEPVIVHNQPKVHHDDVIISSIPVSMTNTPAKKEKIYAETISPSRAEKQTFYDLIKSLDVQNGDAP